jgi:lipopolysaccharide transport protein LptA
VVALRLSITILIVCHCVASTAQEPGRGRLGPVEEWESNSFELDRPSNTMTFDGFRIVGTNWSLTADAASARATELEFEAGEWRFDGNVQLTLDTASLEAGSARFEFRQKRLITVELSGSPVVFEDMPLEGDGPVYGSAQSLRYDDTAGTFALLGSVTLTVGPYRTTGCDLVYYLGQEEFTTGSTQCEERFRTVIVPQASSDAE